MIDLRLFKLKRFGIKKNVIQMSHVILIEVEILHKYVILN